MKGIKSGRSTWHIIFTADIQMLPKFDEILYILQLPVTSDLRQRQVQKGS